MSGAARTLAVILPCEGMGDCLCAVPILRKIRRDLKDVVALGVFSDHPGLFARCPYVDGSFALSDRENLKRYAEVLRLFDTTKLPYHLMDTIDFMSIPAGMGQLSFREKRLEYFPAEADRAQRYDVVLNTSTTWPSRSWPIGLWQRLADELAADGYSVAVVGKTVRSEVDGMLKSSQGLSGCVDLTNRLSLDQTYFTIAGAGLFVTCQNGLSVLCGATETEMIVLDRSIEWSKYAVYRHEDPHYRFCVVKGDCDRYCCNSQACPLYGEFRCIPGYAPVVSAVRAKLSSPRSGHPQFNEEEYVHDN